MENNEVVVSKLSHYWSWQDGLSLELCDLLLKERASFEEIPGEIYAGHEVSGVVNENIRKSEICWAPTNHWIEGILYNHGLYATQNAGWDYVLGRPEQIQLTAYDESGFYGWHEDWDPFGVGNQIRKVSVVALLSDPEDFEGGEFEFEPGVPIKMKKGSVIAFPSFLRHQVTPVTSGKRYSAVCWINGPRTL